jgi:hypothetical protein
MSPSAATLQFLSFRTGAITRAGAEAFAGKLPAIRHIDMYGCDLDEAAYETLDRSGLQFSANRYDEAGE